MVEHQIQHHPDSHAVALVHQLPELLIGSQAGIDVIVIHNVVFVIGQRRKDGVEIQQVDAQIPEIGQIVRHSPQGASQAGRNGHPLLRGPLPGHGLHPAFSLGKAVGKNLIGHAFLEPAGHVGSVLRLEIGQLKQALAAPAILVGKTVLIEIYRLPRGGGQQKKVAYPAVWTPESGFKIIV